MGILLRKLAEEGWKCQNHIESQTTELVCKISSFLQMETLSDIFYLVAQNYFASVDLKAHFQSLYTRRIDHG